MTLHKTKIIATLGPASSKPETVSMMVREGVSGFRVNTAHGDPNEWKSLALTVRSIEKTAARPIALIGDLPGPIVRTGILDEPLQVKRGEKYTVIQASTGRAKDKVIPLPSRKAFEALEEGDVLLVDDGRLRFKVVEVRVDRVVVEALCDGVLSSRKTFTIQGKDLDLPALSADDYERLKVLVEAGYDIIGLSFTRSSSDIEVLRSALRKLGADDVKVLAKIECRRGVENLKEIVEDADYVLVARGDLGLHYRLEEIPWLQKKIVHEARKQGKPVIVATQLLESMMTSPVPTRSEVVDIVTAVKEGCDALMLAGETAVGKYPVEAVKWLRRIVEEAEKRSEVEIVEHELKSLQERYAEGVARLAESLGAKILVYTRTGHTAREIARHRPRVCVYAATPSPRTARCLALVWGVKPFIVEIEDYQEGLTEAYEELKNQEEVSYGDVLVMTYGLAKVEEQHVRIIRVSL